MRKNLQIKLISSISICLLAINLEVMAQEIIKYTPVPKYTPIRIPVLNNVYYTTSSKPVTAPVKPTVTPSQNIPIITPIASKTPSVFPPTKVDLPVVTPIAQRPTVATPISPMATPSPITTPSPTSTPSLVDLADMLAIPIRKEPTTRTVENVPIPVTPTPKVPNKEQGTFDELWKTNYVTAYKNAQKSKRPILVFIGFGTCYQCKELKKDIQSLFTGHYERVYMDREKNPQYKKYFSNYKLAPALLVIDSSNSKIVRKMIGYQHSDFKKLSLFINQ